MRFLLEQYPGDEAAFVLLTALAQAAAVILLAGLGGRALARRNAPLSHALYLAALCLCLLAPAVGMLAGRMQWTRMTVPVALERMETVELYHAPVFIPEGPATPEAQAKEAAYFSSNFCYAREALEDLSLSGGASSSISACSS